jgi:hypothetical protein
MAQANSITVTSLDIVKAAMQEIGALSPGEAPSNEDQAWVLQKLQRLIDRYNARLPMIYNVNFTKFTLPNGVNPITIGPGGIFDVNQRPQNIASIGLLLAGTPGVELPLTERDQDWWANNRIKGLTSTLPTDYYYSPDWPMGNIFFWPVPVASSLPSEDITQEVPGGVIDGTNTVFTLTQPPTGVVWIFVNGIYQTRGLDYTLLGNVITFVVAPTGTMTAAYVIGNDAGAMLGPSETPAGIVNGVNTQFTLSSVPAGAIFVFVNGVYQTINFDYTLNGSTITFTLAPTGIITVNYVPGSHQVNVQTRQILGEFATYAGAFSMPPAYWDAIVYELAISIGPSFEREASSTLIGLWKASIKAIQVNNISSPRLVSDAPSQGGSGAPDFNFLNGLNR